MVVKATFQRIANAPNEKRFVIRPGLERDRVSEQAHSQVRVFEFRARIAAQGVPGEKRVQLFLRVIPKGVGIIHEWIEATGWRKIIRIAREPGHMRRQIQQRDLLAVATRDCHRLRQIFGHRIIQLHLAARDHVLKQQHGEGFADRANLKNRVGVHVAVGAIVELAIADDLRGVLIDKADDDANAMLVKVDVVAQKLLECVWRNLFCHHEPARQQDQRDDR